MIADKAVRQLFRDFIVPPELPVDENDAGRRRLCDKASPPGLILNQLVPDTGKPVSSAVPENKTVVFRDRLAGRFAAIAPVEQVAAERLRSVFLPGTFQRVCPGQSDIPHTEPRAALW